ncbi:hypothetical protein [Eubacterium maltosivorans]|uniref:Uncharacterized protein n=1 Tax=Eubacterium maltosivorans TaxID=2041044 RepID=A0A4V1GLY2_EUBML|nr:hypothetical protein [Eubacterium maltosivorans]QCT71376.1 hypothetical protein CPZ25_008545 [Eubacterium maltosivorans]
MTIIVIEQELDRYIVYIDHLKKSIYLGIFDTEQQAKACKSLNMGVLEDITARYYLILPDRTVHLPNHYRLPERKALCDQIIEHFKVHLTYKVPENSNDNTGARVEERLERLGDYLLSGYKVGKKDGLITEWSERVIAENEIYLSQYDSNTIEI